jgi:hypothetical protein
MQATGKAPPTSIIQHLLNSAQPIPSSDGIHLESMAKQGSGLVQVMLQIGEKMWDRTEKGTNCGIFFSCCSLSFLFLFLLLLLLDL